MPNPELTPGMVASSDARKVCALGDTAELRGYSGRPNTKRAIMRAYGLGNRRSADFELDHRVPLCLGGADVVANLWPQPWPEAREKDKIEEWACRAVCDTHMMSLQAAQAIFLGDWRNFKP